MTVMTAAAFKPQAETAPQSGARLLVSTLERLGVEVVFGYPGGAIMPVYDALAGSKLKHILVRHEQGAAFSADAYAQEERQGRGLHGDVRPRRHQSGHRHRQCDDGLGADRLHHRQRRPRPDGH